MMTIAHREGVGAAARGAGAGGRAHTNAPDTILGRPINGWRLVSGGPIIGPGCRTASCAEAGPTEPRTKRSS